jgi:hypothetical protein
VIFSAAPYSGVQTIISINRENGNNPNSRSKRRHSKTLRYYAVEQRGSGSLKECAAAVYPLSVIYFGKERTYFAAIY